MAGKVYPDAKSALAVRELAHRLKNKIATIQAIISVQLRDQPQVRSDILDRLGALTATDHLIEEANGSGRSFATLPKPSSGRMWHRASQSTGLTSSSRRSTR